MLGKSDAAIQLSKRVTDTTHLHCPPSGLTQKLLRLLARIEKEGSFALADADLCDLF